MKTHLFITAYREKNPERLKELETCYLKNTKAGFDQIIFVVEEKDIDYIHNFLQTNSSEITCTCKVAVLPERPKFQFYVDLANEFIDKNIIWSVCNSDIYIDPENLAKLKSLPWEDRKLFIALSRWDLVEKNNTPVLLDRWDSADTWFWAGKCDIKNANCPIGIPGIDNSLAWKAKDAGYEVFNPSKDIQTFHLHRVQVFNYREGSNNSGAVIADQVCPEPYHFHPTCHIKDITGVNVLLGDDDEGKIS